MKSSFFGKTHYNTLNIPITASALEIKKAYKKCANKYHPDKNLNNPLAEEQFKKISSAYEIIGNEQKRRTYDKFLNTFYNREYAIDLDNSDLEKDLNDLYKQMKKEEFKKQKTKPVSFVNFMKLNLNSVIYSQAAGLGMGLVTYMGEDQFYIGYLASNIIVGSILVKNYFKQKKLFNYTEAF